MLASFRIVVATLGSLAVLLLLTSVAVAVYFVYCFMPRWD